LIKTLRILAISCFLFAGVTFAGEEKQEAFSPYVDSKGNISLPSDFRSTWTHLGTWVVTSQAAAGIKLGLTAPGLGLHEVYTQSESLKSYKSVGKWPDGTMLIQEVRTMKWEDLPTGHVITEGDATEWFVMIKDTKERFPRNTNWGDGWGWALFKPGDLKKNISTDYKEDCLGCHEVAKETGKVFIQGYPTLR
jgi:cytochrome c